MSTQENELSDGQERVGLRRKLTGPPRLLLGKSKSKEKLEGKSQRRQREAKFCDGTMDNNEQENNDGKTNEASHITHNSPQNTSEETATQPEDTSGILVTLEESESKDDNMASKIMTKSTSKTSIKRTFSSILKRGKRKESESWNPKETKKNINNAQNNTCENELSDANNKEVLNGKGKKRGFFAVWFISKRSATSDVGLGRGRKEEDGRMDPEEIAAPKGVTFKKIYRIFSRKKKAPPIDQFECSAPSASQTGVDDQLDQSPAAEMDISRLKREDNQKDNREMQAEIVPETFTFSAEVSINANIGSSQTDEEQICPDQDLNINEKESLELSTSGLLDFEVLPSSSVDCNIVSDLPGTSSDGDQILKPFENDVKCKPVITIEHANSSEEENENEPPQFDALTVNGSWQHLKINGLTNNTLHPDVDHSRCNESLLIQTAISMVQAAIRSAVEQFTIEQQHNHISLDHV